jgi:prepilin-type N-terminal cleavage/methylation domain-containing protein
MRTEKFRAFTLIELLVVIAIIALLLSIIIPSLRKAKEQAKFIVCKNGLHQYGLSGEMYLMDNDNNFPHPHFWLHVYYYLENVSCPWHDPRNNYEVNPENSGMMWPYIASKEIHVCPKLREIAKPYGQYHYGHDPTIPIEPQYSYVMNGYLGDGWYSEVPKKDGVKGPASCFVFAEENPWTLRDLSVWSLNNNHLIGRHEPYMPADISGIF